MRTLKAILITAVMVTVGAAVFLIYNPTGKPRASVRNVTAAHLNLGADVAEAFIAASNPPDYLPIRDYSISDPVVDAKAAIVVDDRSGNILYDKNSNLHLPIASITKLMSAVIVLENMGIDKNYSVPAAASNVDGTKADLFAGEEINGVDLLKYMLIPSSNDAATTFALDAADNHFDFISAMNLKAGQLGLNDTHFTNASGLDDPSAFSSAANVAKLVLYASQYNVIDEDSKIQETTIFSTDNEHSHQLKNTDQLLTQIPSIIVGKTGNTQAALGNMALRIRVSDKDSFTVVVLGSHDRFGDALKLVNFAKKAHTWR